jgi:hypothetical protein
MKRDFISSVLVLDTFEPISPKRKPFTSLRSRFSVFAKTLRSFRAQKPQGMKNHSRAASCPS